MEEAHTALLVRHARATPADLAAARRLLALSREWNETLGVGHRNFEEFLAKTRTIITGTCVASARPASASRPARSTGSSSTKPRAARRANSPFRSSSAAACCWSVIISSHRR
jgi:hypothetical protein